jgi:tripartite-type tricarboxylate transporter receptor subunit TctC
LPPSIPVAGSKCCRAPGRVADRAGTSLSVASDHNDRAVPAGRRQRHAGTHHRRTDARLLGQSIVIENIGGAAGSLGVGRAVRSPSDGYTLNIGSVSSHVLAGAIYSSPYDLVKDLEPVALLAFDPLMIVGRKSMPGSDLKELIAWLKANPGKASQGNPGTGSLGQVIGALFQKETGTQFQSVPYRGGGPAIQDLVAGHIDLMIEPTSNFAQYIPSGGVKPYAVAAGTRVSAAPQVPTVDEAGLPGFYASLWLGLWLPKGTPKDVITKLNSAVIEALTDPAVRRRLADIGQRVPPREQQTPEALGAFQKAEIEKWWPIIKASSIKGE